MLDPFSLWMQSTVFWIKMLKQHQDTYMRSLAAFAQTIPREDAATLAQEAEAMKAALKRDKPAAKPVPKTTARKASPKKENLVTA